MNTLQAVVAGIGIISALGPDRRTFARGLATGSSGISPLSLFNTEGFRSGWAGQASDPHLPKTLSALHRFTRADRLAMHAAEEAIADAKLEPEMLHDAMIILGTGAGGLDITEQYESQLQQKGETKTPAGRLISHQPANATDLLANHFCIGGIRLTIMTACSSSATAIGLALDAIRSGRAQRAIVGGTESLCRFTFAGFSALRAMDDQPCRPFHLNRQGLTLGEAGAILILEEKNSALSRGIEPYAEVAGYGVSSDAYHLTAPSPDGRGAIAAMIAALNHAHLQPKEVDYINAHGTATRHNDPIEIKAIRQVFGSHAERLAISSTKAMTGHTLGAAGAVEAIACALALHQGFLPPTLRLDCPDPECNLDLVPNSPRTANIQVALSNSFAFGGNNTSLVLRKW